MELNDKVINDLFDYCKNFVDTSLSKYEYSNDIKHLLYIIIPAFIVKYGFDNRSKITKTFEEVPIIVSNKDERVLQAFYTSVPFKIGENVITKKCIVLHYYQGKPLMELIDNIVHEYNHAVNSMINEIKEDDKYIYLRTGLMYSKYSKNIELENSKDDSYILEEIINTKQTEEIIDIINSFNRYTIINEGIATSLYNVNKYIKNNYSSEAYLLQSTLCKELMENKTLISVLSNLRFLGNIEEIDYFFDNVTGIDNSYNKLISILTKSVKLEEEFSKIKFFKRKKIREIRKLYFQAKDIVDTFNSNYHFK